MTTVNNLPTHGRVDCTKCFNGCSVVEFDKTRREDGKWRITANPLAWGNIEPEVIVLGFSKGPTQAGALNNTRHENIAYKGGRANIGKIFKHVGLLEAKTGDDLGQLMNGLIADRKGRFHFGSVIRCTVEQSIKNVWKGSGGGMLDKFVATDFGKEISSNCANNFLKNLPQKTKLIVMFGMGSKLNYVRESFELFKKTRCGQWSMLANNDVAYTDGKVTVVHVEHFASQGALIPQWLGAGNHARSRFGEMAAKAVALAIA